MNSDKLHTELQQRHDDREKDYQDLVQRLGAGGCVVRESDVEKIDAILVKAHKSPDTLVADVKRAHRIKEP